MTERTYAWNDPAPTAEAARTEAGLAMLRRVLDGDLPAPPIAQTLGFDLVEVAEGHAVFAGDPQPWHYNPIGSVHGGVVATLLDSAAGCAVHSRLPAGTAYTSLDISVRFLRPVTVETGRLTATGEVLTMGRRTALAEARLTDANGRLLAHATSGCLLFEVP
ncbi:MAG TPA: PaaI family thioesterase [Mycobacteriales bacterium]|jgi:uncharacterized protein (TIGR00369 family)